jgi:hypothetical protein
VPPLCSPVGERSYRCAARTSALYPPVPPNLYRGAVSLYGDVCSYACGGGRGDRVEGGYGYSIAIWGVRRGTGVRTLKNPCSKTTCCVPPFSACRGTRGRKAGVRRWVTTDPLCCGRMPRHRPPGRPRRSAIHTRAQANGALVHHIDSPSSTCWPQGWRNECDRLPTISSGMK